MVLSSVGVLSVLTVAGLWMKGETTEPGENYVVDFSSIEQENVELAQHTPSDPAVQEEVSQQANTSHAVNRISENAVGDAGVEQEVVTENDLDYDPAFRETELIPEEAQLPGVSGTSIQEAEQTGGQSLREEVQAEPSEVQSGSVVGMTEDQALAEAEAIENMDTMENTLALATTAAIQPALSFGEQETLAWPVVGNILINYSMDKTVYFSTLDQYKYHPAVIIAATEGETITAAADGRITSVSTDPQLGNIVVMDLGDGYALTYGQLKDITVSEGSYVSCGDIIGSVAAPTRYYSVEGCNVYFQMTKDGNPVDPMTRLQGSEE